MHILKLILALAILSAPVMAIAGKVCFGKGEKIHFVANINLKDNSGNALAISRKFTSYCFIFPYNQTDDGFVLTLQADQGKYYPFPSDPEVSELQKANALPSPLPAWETSAIQLIFEAYFLWVMIISTTIIVIYSNYRTRRVKVAA